MRYGKTVTAYHLACRMRAKRVLVLTFKPAVEDAWRTDLESRAYLNDWQYQSRGFRVDRTQIDESRPVVFFGSFQDMLGKDKLGNVKPRNEWVLQLGFSRV
ncbi:hypothetical protein [Paracoccus sanguinis]|uniref:hypothetical protein n=1 Tax=Paracoccus sanguinis TaxID=1545044 RepID=UPI00068BFD30|nr:hypothetical protein [Paracoccus sanguinis]